MSGILFFCCPVDGELDSEAKEAITAAKQLSQALGASVTGAVIGHGVEKAALALSQLANADIHYVDDARLDSYLGDAYVASAKAIIDAVGPDVVLFAQNAETSGWVPQLAARTDAALVTSCSGLAIEAGELIATKSVSGGAARAEYTFNRPLRMAILEPSSYEPAEEIGAPGVLHKIEAPVFSSNVEVLETISEPVGSGPQLKTARVVVSGGLGIGSKENWQLIENAGAALGAAVGGSRAVVDLGWIPHSKQIGFSGLKIRPDVYIAVGISGAIHHLTGIAGAKTVVAINKDPEANIFRVARFGVVGEANEVLPAFVARVQELRSQNH